MAKAKIMLEEAVRMGAKNQITIPHRISKALRLKKGDHMLVRMVGAEHTQSVPVNITPLEDTSLGPTPERGRVMAEALAALASRGTFAEITDPVTWQREVRHERALPAREQ